MPGAPEAVRLGMIVEVVGSLAGQADLAARRADVTALRKSGDECALPFGGETVPAKAERDWIEVGNAAGAHPPA